MIYINANGTLKGTHRLKNISIHHFYSNKMKHDQFSIFSLSRELKQYTPKKHEHFGIKIYKIYNTASYTYSMNVYLGEDG